MSPDFNVFFKQRKISDQQHDKIFCSGIQIYADRILDEIPIASERLTLVY